MTRSDHVHHVQITRLDHPVEMGVDQVHSRRGSEMTEETWLDMFRPQGLRQKRIVHQVDLADRAVVGGAPIAIDCRKLFVTQGIPGRRPMR